MALTLDHGLRAGSAAEAKQVGDILAAQAIPHHILSWDGEKPETHIQELARQARYQILTDECRKRGFDFMAVGHNLEDQMETFWMRLAHGSGLEGLAGMAASRLQNNVTILRPLLQVSRADLRGYCHAENITYVDDPSNENERFLRVKLRGFEDMLRAEGLSPQRLFATLQKLETARDALRWAADKAFDECVTFTQGAATLDKNLWCDYPGDIQHRVMIKLLQSVHPQDYPPDHAALERLCAGMRTADFSGRTLGGCILAPRAKGMVHIRREVDMSGSGGAEHMPESGVSSGSVTPKRLKA